MRLIDVSVLKEWIENWFTKNRYYHPYAKNNNIPITELYDILEQLPSAQPEQTVDAVEVVRCKDCKWFVQDGDGWGTCVEDASKWEEDGYCSWGELKGEEE